MNRKVISGLLILMVLLIASTITKVLFAGAVGFPDEGNTGPTGPLTPSGEIKVTTNGTVIQNLDIKWYSDLNSYNHERF